MLPSISHLLPSLFRRKAGYKEIEHLSKAVSEPVISEPEVQGGYPIDESFRFLILMSGGVYAALEESMDGLSLFTAGIKWGLLQRASKS